MAKRSPNLRRLAGRLKRSSVSAPLKIELRDGEEERLKAIFNADWYGKQNPDVVEARQDPWTHFLSSGLSENRNPTPLFDPDYYSRHTNVPSGVPRILHYLRSGDRGLSTPSALFDLEWYQTQVLNLEGSTVLEHYLSTGCREALSPNRLFSPAWILNSLGLEGLNGTTPLEHYVLQGPSGELDPHPWFSNSAYRRFHVDVTEAHALPLAHLLEWGAEQSRDFQYFVTPYSTNSFDVEWLETSVGRAPLTCLAESGIFEWIENEPLARNLVGHLNHAHRTAALALKHDDKGILALDWPARAKSIQIPKSLDPEVSIIIPTLNHADDVIRCLESVMSCADKTAYEVVLIDDGSDHQNTVLFKEFSGVKVLRNDPNRGFAQSCTRGIDESSAPAVMLLNNDTEVLDGWLDYSVALLDDKNRHVGAVGTMVLAGDLSLQDAGCQLVGEGIPTQVGRGQNPLDATFNIVRPITYGSGCSLLIRRSAFEEVGGFDPQFEPAFFEENDLCRMIDQAGYEILYSPSAAVIHREGSTLGRHGTPEREALFDRQAARYYKKWRGAAANLPPEDASGFDLVFHQPFQGACVLVIDHRLPEPLHDSGSYRMTQLLLELKRQGKIPVVLSAFDFVRPSSARILSALGISLLTTHLEDAELPEILNRLLPEIEFVIVARPNIALQARSLIALVYPGAPFVFDSVDSHTLRSERRHALENSEESRQGVVAARLMERSVLEFCDLAISLSREDETSLASLLENPPPFVLLPNVHPALPVSNGPEGRTGLLFVGGYEHEPNVDAVQWFCTEILPLIEEQAGPLPVTLAGSKPTKEVRALASPSILVPGWIEDLGPLYNSARVVIAPLRYGAGVKGKVGEALANGVPVVTTTIGAEGMMLTHGRDVEVADDPVAFATAVLGLLKDDERWISQSTAGRATIDAVAGLGATREAVSNLLTAVEKISKR